MAAPLWLGGALGGAIAGGLSYFSGRSANRARAREARLNRVFQERMSSTAHQRAVKDLRAAGLNPILSATGGMQASSPGGSMAQQQDVGTPAIASALSVRRAKSEIANIDARTELTDAQRRVLGPVSKGADVVSGGIEAVVNRIGGKSIDYKNLWQEFLIDIGGRAAASSAAGISRQSRALQKRFAEWVKARSNVKRRKYGYEKR